MSVFGDVFHCYAFFGLESRPSARKQIRTITCEKELYTNKRFFFTSNVTFSFINLPEYWAWSGLRALRVLVIVPDSVGSNGFAIGIVPRVNGFTNSALAHPPPELFMRPSVYSTSAPNSRHSGLPSRLLQTYFYYALIDQYCRLSINILHAIITRIYVKSEHILLTLVMLIFKTYLM